jgi:hypothetical protein
VPFELFGSGMEDQARGLRILIEKIAGKHLIEGRADIRTYFLWYRSAEADFSCQYFLIQKIVPYVNAGQTIEAQFRPAIVVSKSNLLVSYSARVSRHRGGEMPSQSELDQLLRDVQYVLVRKEHDHNAEYKGITLPDPKVLFVETVPSDTEAASILDQAAAEAGY